MTHWRPVLVQLTSLALLSSLVVSGTRSAAAATSALDFRNDMRKLWEDHVQWTRFYIVEAAADLPGKEITALRPLQNQTDIGNAVKAFYGEDAGNRLTALLKDHFTSAVDVLAAAKADDKAGLDAAKARWYANADEIATFLSAANPSHWPLETMKSEMKMHLDVTLEEATAQLKGDGAGSVAAYDRVHAHILRLADALSTGVLHAKPEAAMPSSLPRTGAAGFGGQWPLLGVLVGGILMVVGLRIRRRASRTATC